jgi:hypothetical protein
LRRGAIAAPSSAISPFEQGCVEAKMSSVRDICDLRQARAASGRNAFQIVKTSFASIITTLQRDARFADITRFDFELLLANEYRDLEKILFQEIHDRVHLDEAEDAVRCCLGED